MFIGEAAIEGGHSTMSGLVPGSWLVHLGSIHPVKDDNEQKEEEEEGQTVDVTGG